MVQHRLKGKAVKCLETQIDLVTSSLNFLASVHRHSDGDADAVPIKQVHRSICLNTTVKWSPVDLFRTILVAGLGSSLDRSLDRSSLTPADPLDSVIIIYYNI